jgi:hypothetical protein
MAANNFYLGLKMGDEHNIDKVQASASSNSGPGAGTAAEVEVRIMTDPGTGANNITCKDVVEKLLTIVEFINSKNPTNGGANLPAL